MLDGWSDQTMQQREEELLAMVPPDGKIGNKTLRGQLCGDKAWDETWYFPIRNRLIDRGLLIKGRGKGGSVRLVKTEPPPQSAAKGELALYDGVRREIHDKWTIDSGLDQYVVEITGKQGSKSTGGRWTRPDITVVSIKTYPYVPGCHFDVTTFEVKPTNQVDITSVYEALAHRRAAHQSFVLLHVPDEDNKKRLETTLDEICREAKAQGIGVIIVEKADDYDSWDEVVEAVRQEPNPERLNEFLAQQVSLSAREKIIKWSKCK